MVARSHICPYNGNCRFCVPFCAGPAERAMGQRDERHQKNKTAEINIIQIA